MSLTNDCQADWAISGEVLAIEEHPVSNASAGIHEVLVLASGHAAESVLRGRKQRYDAVVIDLPPPPKFDQADSEWQSWIHTLKKLMSLAENVTSASGVVVVEAPDSALLFVRSITSLSLARIAVWKKKYAPQNDAERLIESMHDFILIFQRRAVQTITYDYLPWETVGKSEDATREFQERLEELQIEQPTPIALKPKLFWKSIAESYLSDCNSILDLNYSGWGVGDFLPKLKSHTAIVWSSPQHPHSAVEFLTREWACSFQPVGGVSVSTSDECVCALASITASQTEDSSARNFGVEAIGDLASADQVVITHTDQNQEGLYRLLDKKLPLVFVEQSTGLDRTLSARRILTRDGAIVVDAWTGLEAAGNSLALLSSFRTLGSLVLVTEESTRGSCDLFLVLSARSARSENLSSLGRTTTQEFENPDDDPRGPWRDPGHKGARSGSKNTSFEIHLPPYSWRVNKGELPPGLWRLNPETGVIWGVPKKLGRWNLSVQVADLKTSKTANVEIRVVEKLDSQPVDSAEVIQEWVSGRRKSSSQLEFRDQEFVVEIGKPRSLALVAEGGSQRVGVIEPPGEARGESRTRYWEFSISTLVQAIQSDRVIWGSDGPSTASRPRIKKFQSEARLRRTGIRSVCAGRENSKLVGIAKCTDAFDSETYLILGDSTSFLRRTSGGSRNAQLKIENCTRCDADAQGIPCSKEHAFNLRGLLLDNDWRHSIEIGSTDRVMVILQRVIDAIGDVAGYYCEGIPLSDPVCNLLAEEIEHESAVFFAKRLIPASIATSRAIKVLHR